MAQLRLPLELRGDAAALQIGQALAHGSTDGRGLTLRGGLVKPAQMPPGQENGHCGDGGDDSHHNDIINRLFFHIYLSGAKKIPLWGHSYSISVLPASPKSQGPSDLGKVFRLRMPDAEPFSGQCCPNGLGGIKSVYGGLVPLGCDPFRSANHLSYIIPQSGMVYCGHIIQAPLKREEK